MSQGPTELFVYGTLLSGEENAGWLGGLSRQHARVKGSLYRLPAGYPVLVQGGPAEGGSEWVEGELVMDVGERLSILDRVEGVDRGLFQRIELPVVVGGRTVKAWGYVMEAGQVRARLGVLLKDGSWRKVSVGSVRG